MRVENQKAKRVRRLLDDGAVGVLLIVVLTAVFLGVFFAVRGALPMDAPASPRDDQGAVFIEIGRSSDNLQSNGVPQDGHRTAPPSNQLAVAELPKKIELAPKLDFERELAPFFASHCFECHTGDAAEAGLTLDQYKVEASVTKHRKTFAKILKMLRAGLMPPPDEVKPPPREKVDRIAAWIDWKLKYVDCTASRDPGRVTIRRLNRVEYANTIRDLLGVDFPGTKDFPADDVGYGFDNIGDVLSLPTILMEKYLKAAETIVAKAIVTDDPSKTKRKRYDATETQGGVRRNGPWRGLYSVGDVGVDHLFPLKGAYVLRALAYGDQAGGEPVKMEFHLDGRKVGVSEVKAVRNKPAFYQHRVSIPSGRHRFSVRFINDYYRPKNPNPRNRDRNLYVGVMEVQGPLGVKTKLPATHTRIITVTPSKTRSWESCAREILRKFLPRAYRRPVADAEIDRLLRFVKLAKGNGDNFEQSIALTIQALLVSPHFLFRIELDPEPGDPKSIRTITEHELAVRLSYFLWSSMPDEELFRQARGGTLRRNLANQIRRMIRDPKCGAFVASFVGQWLQIRNLDVATPDPKRFPTWNAALRNAMRTETEMFFAAVMREDRSVFEFIDADYTFLNGRLARHYGIDGVSGERFRRVALTDGKRGGVLTQASVLTITSGPTRTVPVKRGKWILEQILGVEPPPPPANVEQLDDQKQLTGSLRQRLEQHRSKPSCAVCHRQMDPLGFAFENYNAIGVWRDRDGKYPVDASGELPGGRKFSGAAELKIILKADDEKFRRCLAEKMLTYALGRGLEYYDKCALDDICKELKQNGDRFQTLVQAIAKSDPFQKRRGKRKE